MTGAETRVSYHLNRTEFGSCKLRHRNSISTRKLTQAVSVDKLKYKSRDAVDKITLNEIFLCRYATLSNHRKAEKKMRH